MLESDSKKIQAIRLSMSSPLAMSSATVSSKARQTIPPRTGRLLPVQVNELSVQDTTDSVFSFKDSFIRKINKLHPQQDENYLGLNSVEQAVSLSNSGETEVYFFNETQNPIIISSNCIIGSVSIPEHDPSVINMTKVMAISEEPLKPSDWMNNAPSDKLSHSSHDKRKEYIKGVLDFKNNSILQKKFLRLLIKLLI